MSKPIGDQLKNKPKTRDNPKFKPNFEAKMFRHFIDSYVVFEYVLKHKE
jgi:hypothetical protein